MEVLDRGYTGNSNGSTDRDTMYLLGGVALVVFGTGLILSSRTTQRLLGQLGFGDLTQALIPDVERYMKLRSM